MHFASESKSHLQYMLSFSLQFIALMNSIDPPDSIMDIHVNQFA